MEGKIEAFLWVLVSDGRPKTVCGGGRCCAFLLYWGGPGGGNAPGPIPMKCPFCGHSESKVVDSRESQEAQSIRRRRECLSCERRFTTYERVDEIPYMVIKKDGRREKFDRQKVLAGLLRACEKRPVSTSRLEEIANEVEVRVADAPDREIPSQQIGELLMSRLRELDKVAYVRFASVYLDFKDIKEFMDELKELLRSPKA